MTAREAAERLHQLEAGELAFRGNAERLRSMLEARMQGQTLREVARQHGVSHQCVQGTLGRLKTRAETLAGRQFKIPRCPCQKYSKFYAQEIGHECAANTVRDFMKLLRRARPRKKAVSKLLKAAPEETDATRGPEKSWEATWL